MLGMSHRTVWRGIREYSWILSCAYTEMCDEDLDEHILAIQLLFPNCGQRMMDGHLRAQGVVVQNKRIIKENALWHIRSVHSLYHISNLNCKVLMLFGSRWRLIVHGGILDSCPVLWSTIKSSM